MTNAKERSIDELYQDDPERADAVVFGRKPTPSRRGFLGGCRARRHGRRASAAPFRLPSHMPKRPHPCGFRPDGARPARRRRSPPRGRNTCNSPARATSWCCSATGRSSPRRRSTCSTTTPRRPTSSSSATTGKSPRRPRSPDTWKIVVDGEVNNKLELTLGELKTEVPGRHAPHGARMRRQRPLVLHAAGARQPMDQWRGRLRRVDRRARRRRAEGAG